MSELRNQPTPISRFRRADERPIVIKTDKTSIRDVARRRPMDDDARWTAASITALVITFTVIGLGLLALFIWVF